MVSLNGITEQVVQLSSFCAMIWMHNLEIITRYNPDRLKNSVSFIFSLLNCPPAMILSGKKALSFLVITAAL
jgi:hypothetical protein